MYPHVETYITNHLNIYASYNLQTSLPAGDSGRIAVCGELTYLSFGETRSLFGLVALSGYWILKRWDKSKRQVTQKIQFRIMHYTATWIFTDYVLSLRRYILQFGLECVSLTLRSMRNTMNSYSLVLLLALPLLVQLFLGMFLSAGISAMHIVEALIFVLSLTIRSWSGLHKFLEGKSSGPNAVRSQRNESSLLSS